MSVLSPTADPSDVAFAAMRDGVAVVGPDGRLRHANAAWTALTGGADDPLVHLLAVAPGGDVTEVDLPLRDGATAPLLVSVDAAGEDGTVVVVVRPPTGRLARAVELAERDPLTGLLNRRGFEDHARRALAAARRGGRPVSLAIVDLDHFKRVNDRFGHPAGDAVLQATADRLRAAARPGDVLARIGGEEFAWLLPDATAGQAASAGDRARAALAAAPLTPGVRITASVGVCELTGEDDAAGLYRRADQALYWAKSYGRDMTLIWTPGAAERLAGDEAHRASWAHLLEIADSVDAIMGGERRHSARVAELSVALAVHCDWDARGQARLHQAARVHDVGKVAIPRHVLEQPGALDAAQLRQVHQHPGISAALAGPSLDAEQAGWVRHHHEWWDGTGYPDRLAGTAIAEGAQLLALADAYAAMTDDRPYSRAMSQDDALADVRAFAGRAFRPDAAELLERALAWLQAER